VPGVYSYRVGEEEVEVCLIGLTSPVIGVILFSVIQFTVITILSTHG